MEVKSVKEIVQMLLLRHYPVFKKIIVCLLYLTLAVTVAGSVRALLIRFVTLIIHLLS